MWVDDELTVSVDHCLGLRSPKGTTICAFPYFKADQVTSSVIAGTVRIVEVVQEEVLPDAVPAVLEVRTGRLHKLAGGRNRETIDCWLHSEANGYCAHWHAAA